MSNSSYKYESNESYSLIAEGDYEAVIERIEKRRTPNNKEKLSIMYRINPDVPQAHSNRVIFEDIWAEKDNPEVYNRKRINQLLGTQEDVEDGQIFESADDVIDFLLDKNLILHITIEFDTYRGEDRNNVAYYKSSKFKPQTVGKSSLNDESVIDKSEEEEPKDDFFNELPF